MKYLILLLFPLQLLSQKTSILFNNVNIIDVEKGIVIGNKNVLVEGNKIKNISPKSLASKNSVIINAKGKYLIPGLWDNYTYTLDAIKKTKSFQKMMIAHAVTGVRDAETSIDLKEAEQLQRNINEGVILAPRIFYSGRHINGTNLKKSGALLSYQVTDTNEAIRYIDTLAQSGVDYISLGTVLPPEFVSAVAAAAKKKGLPVVQWATLYSFADASNAGVNCIQHFADLYRTTSAKRNEYFAFTRERRSRTMTEDEIYKFFSSLRAAPDKKYYEETIKTLALNKTFIVTNFAEQAKSKAVFEFRDSSRRRYMTPSQVRRLDSLILEWDRKIKTNDFRTSDAAWKGLLQDVSNLHKAGVVLLAGTQSDHEDGSPGIWLHDELYWFVQAGLSPFEALKTATINPAIFMRREKELGTIEVGKLADLVLLDANPLEDISNTRKINAVVANGRLLQRRDLDKLLQEVKGKVKVSRKRI
jgi:imidazolonepropionase-like amidohydrolase